MKLITVDGDKTRLVQVLANILHNASKFMDPGGRIHLTVTREASQVVIAVSDTGMAFLRSSFPGFSTCSRRFIPKRNTNAGRTWNRPGAGAAADRDARRNRGGSQRGPWPWHRDHRSHSGVGDGDGCDESGGRVGAVAVVEPRRILVADDNHDAAESLALQLQLAGHEVRTVHDGVEALDVAAGLQARTSFCSTSACRRWMGTRRRERCGSVPGGKRATLIALTGWGQPQDRQRTTDAGFDAHLVKPVSESQLFQALASAGQQKSSVASAGQDNVHKASSRLRPHD